MRAILGFSILVFSMSFLAPQMSLAYFDLANGTGQESGAGGGSHSKTSYGSEKRFNLSFEPIVLLVGFINLDFDIKMSENWTLGPELSYWHVSLASGDPIYTSAISLTAWAVGVRANYYPDGVYQDGWYVSPSFQYVSAKASTISSGQDLSASVSEFAFTLVGGYNWFWDSFNLKFGAGITAASAPSTIHVQSSNGTYSNDVSYSPSSVGLALDFMTGWTF